MQRPLKLRIHYPPLAWVLYGLFVLLTFLTPGWRVGPFTWLPILQGDLAGRPAAVGVLVLLLPAAVLVAIGQWVRGAGWRGQGWLRALQPWQITLPILGLGLWVLVSLRPAAAPGTAFIVATTVLLMWASYVWLAHRPPVSILYGLAGLFAVVMCVQSIVGTAQFWQQGSVGLAALGEPLLDPAVEATSVVGQPGAHHLRAYGLTAHPNVLGGLLTIGLLWVIGAASTTSPRVRIWWLLAIMPGLAGLLLTFSRAAWIGLAVGLVWLVWHGPQVRRWWVVVGVLLGAAIVVLAWWQPTLLWTRLFDWSAPLEARSLNERAQYVAAALDVIRLHPWTGVGSGLYLHALPVMRGQTAVHNALLLATAELGVVGGALWLWLNWAWLAVPWPARPKTGTDAAYTVFHVAVASWLALFTIGLFDNYTWLTASWRAAIMVGLLTGALAAAARRHSNIA